MNTGRIFDILYKRCAGVFVGVFAKDRLPMKLPSQRPLILVCNTDPHKKPGEHWIVLYLDNYAQGEYFDSLAQDPDFIFDSYLKKYCANYVKNDKQIQSVISAFCGQYCVFYSLFKYLGYSLEDICNCFSNDTALNDMIVHKFVCENM